MELVHVTQPTQIPAPKNKTALQEITSAENFSRPTLMCAEKSLNCCARHILFCWRWKEAVLLAARGNGSQSAHVRNPWICGRTTSKVNEVQQEEMFSFWKRNFPISSSAKWITDTKSSSVWPCLGGERFIQAYARKWNLRLGQVFHLRWTFADVWQSWKIKAISHKSGTTEGIIKQSANGLPTIYWTDEKSILTLKEKEDASPLSRQRNTESSIGWTFFFSPLCSY